MSAPLKRLMKNPSVGLTDAVLAAMKAHEDWCGVEPPGEQARSKRTDQQAFRAKVTGRTTADP
jgi:hypothetical protein